jgi:RHH-type proline utilization regulon transcriptional repressor/proline dehydrogenase/delta 1-pyrroline-5-carboxylate dehydrogenase
MIAGAAAELRLGDPADPATDMGPVIDADALALLQDHAAAMKDSTVFAGSLPADLPPGHFFPPHIIELSEVGDLTREVFGPILHVVRWQADAFDDLLDAIDATGYGLTLGVHSRIDAVADKVIRRLPVGNIYVNRNMIGAIVGSQPFGGSGLSGTGPKAGGPTYLLRFAEEQVVAVNTAAVGGNAALLTATDE